MSALAPRLLAWHRDHGRHDLPWQHPRTPYRIWLSEVMLQQTRVATVIGYFERFVQALPDLPDLAQAGEDQVLALWSGLGYYRRARNLHQAARICMREHGGQLPADFDALGALPGIGRSTAGAILAFAHGQCRPILDGNAKRVLARHFAVRGWSGKAAVERELWRLAAANTPDQDVAAYTQAIMDLGSSVCSRVRPACSICPLAHSCAALRQGLVELLPAPRPRRTLPERELCMLVLIDADGRVLLERRGGHGVWPRLWSLPEAPDASAAAVLARHLGATEPVVHELPFMRHAFTHFRLRIRPLVWSGVAAAARVADDDNRRWAGETALERLGMPAPVRRLLQSIRDSG